MMDGSSPLYHSCWTPPLVDPDLLDRLAIGRQQSEHRHSLRLAYDIRADIVDAGQGARL